MKTKLLILCLFLACQAWAQGTREIKSTAVAGTNDIFSSVPAPALFVNRSDLHTSATSTIRVTFASGYPDSAKKAFLYADSIWSYLLRSTVPINILARWDTLPGGALSTGAPDTMFKNFPGAPEPDIYYPVALAEALSGQNLNAANDTDIVVTVNKKTSWYCLTDGVPQSMKYDLVTTVLHEIGHGLGFCPTFSFDSASGIGRWGIADAQGRFADVYDRACAIGPYYQNGTRLTTSDEDSTTILGRDLQSGNIYFDGGYSSYRVNDNKVPKLYAPSKWLKGSSISHLDSATYPVGNSNSLMKYRLNPAEVIQSPGEVGLNILSDLGWPVNRLITITSPSPGVSLRGGSTTTIRWSDNTGGNVSIWLVRKGLDSLYYDFPHNNITSGFIYSNIGKTDDTLRWRVDSTLATGDYRIKMLDELSGVGYGLSSAFRISNLPQVAKPSITPPGAIFAQGDTILVTITCTTGGATIRYSDTGRDPDSTSAIYSFAPLRITSAKLIIAKAFKSGYEPSMSDTAAFTISSGTTVTQLDENNQFIGPYWVWRNDTYWEQQIIPSAWIGTSVLSVKSYQGFKEGTNQKYNRWIYNRNENTPFTINYADISRTSGSGNLAAHFKGTSSVIVQAQLLEGGNPGGIVNFKDPWLIDTVGSKAGQPQNRGIAAKWYNKTSPFRPDSASSHMGVFLN